MPPKKMPLAKKLIIIGAALILLQGIYIAVFSTEDQRLKVKDAISNQVATNPAIKSDRQDMVRLQLALASFKLKNKKLPKQLNELVPDFIDSVPLDPKTGTQFKYTVTGDRYVLGDPKAGGTGTAAGESAPGTDEQSRLIAYLDKPEEEGAFSYDGKGKKDPFRSFDFTSKTAETVGDTPLESYAYDELKLAAVLEGIGEPRAVIEDPRGKGHMVGVGTKIGSMGGVIEKIEKNKVIILEKRVDFTGEESSRTIELHMR